MSGEGQSRYIVIDLPYPHWEAKRTVAISSDSALGLTLRVMSLRGIGCFA